MMEDKEHTRKIMKVRHCVCKHSYKCYIRIWTAQVVSSNSVRKTFTQSFSRDVFPLSDPL